MNWAANTNARNATRAIAALDRAWDRAWKRGDDAEKGALSYAITKLEQAREESREHIAEICGPWFDGSCFDIQGSPE